MENLYQRRLGEVKGNVVQSWFIYSSVISDKRIDAYSNERGYSCPGKGKEIPRFGRIVAIADFYDAL